MNKYDRKKTLINNKYKKIEVEDDNSKDEIYEKEVLTQRRVSSRIKRFKKIKI